MSKKNFWTKETEQAIKQYCFDQSLSKRDLEQIYKNEIHQPFISLANYIYFKDNKLYNDLLTKDEAESIGLAKAVEILIKSRNGDAFNPNQAKAYSYWYRSIWNEFVQTSKDKQKRRIGHFSISNDENKGILENKFSEFRHNPTNSDKQLDSQFLNQFCDWIEVNMADLWKDESNREIARYFIEAIANYEPISKHPIMHEEVIAYKDYLDDKTGSKYSFQQIRTVKKTFEQIFNRLEKLYQKKGFIEPEDVIYMRRQNYPGSPSKTELKNLLEKYREELEKKGLKSYGTKVIDIKTGERYIPEFDEQGNVIKREEK